MANANYVECRMKNLLVAATLCGTLTLTAITARADDDHHDGRGRDHERHWHGDEDRHDHDWHDGYWREHHYGYWGGERGYWGWRHHRRFFIRVDPF
jgi:hypothetical protein